MNLTKAQTYVSDFLYNIYLESDSKELDSWLAYLARENGDEQLAKMMGEFEELCLHMNENVEVIEA